MPMLLFLALPIMTSYAQEAPLPNWIDHTREKEEVNIQDLRVGTPPPAGEFRIPAEYEPIKAVVSGYAGFTTLLNNIGSAVLKETGAEFWALSGSGSVGKQIDCPIDTSWIRDYGPFGIHEKNSGEKSIAIVDSIYRHYSYRVDDDRSPACVAKNFGFENYELPLILDGGNFLIDSKGNFFTTTRTYHWNSKLSKEQVNDLLKKYYNVKTIHVLEYAGHPSNPADGTGHIDMYVKLLSDDTVLIAETENEPFKTACEKAVKLFSNLKSPSGAPYKILRSKGWVKGRTWYTYTNSLIVNNVVLMPTYAGAEASAQQAKSAYEAGMSNVKVKMINSDASITSGGSIHCLTQTIPAI